MLDKFKYHSKISRAHEDQSWKLASQNCPKISELIKDLNWMLVSVLPSLCTQSS
jgi:hypothetical protein